jgi:hypothetical protein
LFHVKHQFFAGLGLFFFAGGSCDEVVVGADGLGEPTEEGGGVAVLALFPFAFCHERDRCRDRFELEGLLCALDVTISCEVDDWDSVSIRRHEEVSN